MTRKAEDVKGKEISLAPGRESTQREERGESRGGKSKESIEKQQRSRDEIGGPSRGGTVRVRTMLGARRRGAELADGLRFREKRAIKGGGKLELLS